MIERLTCGLAALFFFFPAVQAADERKPIELTFEKHIRPILKAYCFECHGEGKRLRGSLDLRLVRFAKKGGDSGPAIVPGDAAKSYLYQRIRKQEMPPGKGKVPPEKIELIGRWIAQGAKTERPEPEKLAVGVYFTPEERNFWSFQPIRRPAVPRVKDVAKVLTPIDAFLLARLEAQGLSFGPLADKAVLIRRLYFDLIGLPPSPAEVEAFLRDDSPDAYEKLVDRLLASPHYGERWGRHWLDAAGYADSEGYANEDAVRPYAWKYRDYVIRSFNADKPWNQFLVEQLAGDELAGPIGDDPSPRQIELLTATGFLRMAPDGTGSRGVDQKVARNDVIADTLQIVSTSILGLTMQCARCHNHKYDPITQEDYYRLRAVFEPALNWKNWKPPAARRVKIFPPAARKLAAKIEAEAAKIDAARSKRQAELVQQVFERELAKIPEQYRAAARKAKETPASKRTAEQKALLRKFPRVDIRVSQLRLYDPKAARELQKFTDRANKIRARKPKPDYVRALTEPAGKVPVTFLFERGDHEAPRQRVEPGHPVIFDPLELGSIPVDDPSQPTSGRRLAFARQLTSGRHPLVPRVIVNRVWLHHFGRGIVASPGDFGMLGDRPSHPELLDWLADEFIRRGWRLKPLHKLIVMSYAYRQSSRRRPELEKIDPDNRLLGRMNLRRLEGEILRDAALAVSGKLNPKAFGPPVPVTPTPEGSVVIGIDTRDNAGRFTGKIGSVGSEAHRRSIYVQVRRSQPLSVLETFDAPVMSPNCVLRTFSTVTPQSLLLMNSEFIHRLAGDFAARVESETGGKGGAAPLHEVVKHAWQLAFAVRPTPKQLEEATSFIENQMQTFRRTRKMSEAEARRAAVANFCQALLASNRFLYVD